MAWTALHLGHSRDDSGLIQKAEVRYRQAVSLVHQDKDAWQHFELSLVTIWFALQYELLVARGIDSFCRHLELAADLIDAARSRQAHNNMKPPALGPIGARVLIWLGSSLEMCLRLTLEFDILDNKIAQLHRRPTAPPAAVWSAVQSDLLLLQNRLENSDSIALTLASILGPERALNGAITTKIFNDLLLLSSFYSVIISFHRVLPPDGMAGVNAELLSADEAASRILLLWRAVIIHDVFQSMVTTSHHGVDPNLEVKATAKSNGCKAVDSETSAHPDSLISYDAEMVSNASDIFYALTASVASTCMAMTMLYQILGWGSLFGIAALVLLTPLPTMLSQWVARLHHKVMTATDSRLLQIADCLRGIRTLKLFAWDQIMSERIEKTRATEQQRIWKRNMAAVLVAATGDMLSLLSLTVLFTVLIIVKGQPLRAPIALTSLTIIEVLRSHPFDEPRYLKVLDACDLLNDLSHFPDGDLTIAGEKGSTLSGGQKQRVSLARALYSTASILLLDDVFSALDVHTTTRVYDRCFRSRLLQNRTVILVTQLREAIEDAQLVVRLDHGSLSWTSDRTVAHSVDFFGYMALFGSPTRTIMAVVSALTVQLVYFSIPLGLSRWTGSNPDEDAMAPATAHFLTFVVSIVAFLFFQLLNNVVYQRGGWQAAKTMHRRLVVAVMGAPVGWFDRTPLGQMINRFGVDMQSLDSVLVDWLRMTIDNCLRFLLRVASISSIMPIFAFPVGLCCIVGFATGEVYSRAEISIKRLVATQFSPVLSLFSDTSTGLHVIRGHQGAADMFRQQLADRLAAYMRAAEAQYNCNRWVSIRSDCCAAVIAGAAGFIAYRRGGSSGLVGFSLANAIGLSQTILTLVRNMNELEIELSSVQRISEYTNIEGEEALCTGTGMPSTRSVPLSWPATGSVEFQHATIRYDACGPSILRGVTFAATAGERIAIVGRTGSGKSTLALSLLRATQIATGRVVIDGVDIREVSLSRLRSSICLIPQETHLFTGDVKSNIDPSNDADEARIQSILATCNTARNGGEPGVGAQSLFAHTAVLNGGSNFSSGQRQIIGLARALYRQAKVVILDEATASVDEETDAQIQVLIRSEFAPSTIIAIAHRLRTVMDYDRVIVMQDGTVMENGSPSHLVQARGAFWSMVNSTGGGAELLALMKSQ
ncbi:nitrate assimilation regulatory protein nirA [Purpureocillium lavendulum]|uniref:Nitrate assimilation regulatory protein nirA n=1 Tax=Purpureocillium lavendulum TaxID=1247861 RepID=A0AB34FID7_9HYPO|nr:nitrate assimilation regulatory protein nirA [Purpureocillium lavendulum]